MRVLGRRVVLIHRVAPGWAGPGLVHRVRDPARLRRAPVHDRYQNYYHPAWKQLAGHQACTARATTQQSPVDPPAGQKGSPRLMKATWTRRYHAVRGVGRRLRPYPWIRQRGRERFAASPNEGLGWRTRSYAKRIAGVTRRLVSGHQCCGAGSRKSGMQAAESGVEGGSRSQRSTGASPNMPGTRRVGAGTVSGTYARKDRHRSRRNSLQQP